MATADFGSKRWWLLVIRMSKNGPFKENLTLAQKQIE